MDLDVMYEGNSKEILKQFEDNSFDSIVTDPPYELAFMGKRWDSSGITYDVKLWQECLRILKPGGHLLAFGGTRTYHRMTCAIEDAGFEIRDSIHWVYGNGFPKSKDTALKPAHEPIVMARKPLAEKTVVANVLEWGTGSINIDGCRIPTHGEHPRGSGKGQKGTVAHGDRKDLKGGSHTPDSGRFPANLIHDGSEEVLAEFAKAGERSSGGPSTYTDKYTIEGHKSNCLSGKTNTKALHGYADEGNVARFFQECPSIIYQSKASKKERGGSTHPTIKPLSLISYLVRMVTPKGGIVLDPFLGSGTLALAAEAEGMRWVGIDLDLTEARKRIHDYKMP